MDPNLTAQLQQLLAAMLSNVQDGATWAKGQIPLLVQEKIAFGRAWELALLVLLLALLIGMWRGAYPAWKTHDFEDEVSSGMVGIFLVALPTLLLIIFSIEQVHDVLLVWFAPRLYIVEWLVGMTKSK